MRTARIILGLIIVCLLFSLPAAAQTTTSTIEGTVKDANGAIMPAPRSGKWQRLRPSEVPRPTGGVYRLTSITSGPPPDSVADRFATSTSNIELTLNRVVTSMSSCKSAA